MHPSWIRQVFVLFIRKAASPQTSDGRLEGSYWWLHTFIAALSHAELRSVPPRVLVFTACDTATRRVHQLHRVCWPFENMSHFHTRNRRSHLFLFFFLKQQKSIFFFKQQQKSIFLKLLVVDKSHQMLIS